MNERDASGMPRWHPFSEYRRDRRWAGILALALALALHLGVLLLLPAELLPPASARDAGEEAVELELVPPEPMDPEKLRFVEANPEVPENEPDRSDQYSFRAQQAADEAPETSPSEAPRVDGEEASQKVVQGSAAELPPLPPGVYAPDAAEAEKPGREGGSPDPPPEAAAPQATPLPPPDFLAQEPVDVEGPGSRPDADGRAPEAVKRPEPDVPVDVYRAPEAAQDANPAEQRGDGGQPEARPAPRERPRLDPELVQGPLMRSMGSASRRGAVAIDATFSEFGEYQQQFYAAVQAGWYQEIEFFQPIDTSTRVQVRFTMRADGSIHNLEVLHSTASEIATVICESAISKRSPFRPWTREMVEVFGEARSLTVMFHYR